MISIKIFRNFIFFNECFSIYKGTIMDLFKKNIHFIKPYYNLNSATIAFTITYCQTFVSAIKRFFVHASGSVPDACVLLILSLALSTL